MLKLATWNIGSLYDGRDDRHGALYKTLSDYSPDIIAIEELPEEDSLIDSLKVCLKAEHHKFVRCSESHVAEGKNMGISVFSKYPIGDVRILHVDELSLTDYEYCGRVEHLHRKYFMAAEIIMPEGDRRLVVTGHGYPVHRYSIPEEIFAPAFLQIDNWIAELLSGYDVKKTYMMCDFNIPRPLDYMPFSASEFKDPFEHVGTRPSGRKTDSVLVHRDTIVYEVVNIGVGFDHNFVMISV